MRALSKKWQLVIMIGPAAIFYLSYLMLPVALSVYYSFTNYSGLGSPGSAGVSTSAGRACSHQYGSFFIVDSRTGQWLRA